MFDSLSDKLEATFKKLAGQATINEINIGLAMRDIKRALLGADVNYKVAKKLIEDIREKSLGELILDEGPGGYPVWFSCWNCGEDCWLPLP